MKKKDLYLPSDLKPVFEQVSKVSGMDTNSLLAGMHVASEFYITRATIKKAEGEVGHVEGQPTAYPEHIPDHLREPKIKIAQAHERFKEALEDVGVVEKLEAQRAHRVRAGSFLG